MTWDEGAYNGGSPVANYLVQYKEVDASSYQIYDAAYAGTDLTVTGLTPGVTYRFVVRARNVISLSDFSNEIDVLAA